MKIFIPFVLVLILLLGGFYLVKKTPRYDGIACTMEALLCPDGSAVGRSGPNCEFSPCPNQPSFTGELVEQGGEYRLVVPAPEVLNHEVTYALPVEFSSISNVIGTFVDKYVRVTGSFTTGSTLRVETIEEVTSEEVSQGGLRVGETRVVNGVRITLNGITEDSRCPVDVQCFQMGRLVANVSLRSDTDMGTLDIASDRTTPLLFDIFKISIAKVEPMKLSTDNLEDSDYRLTFKIDR